MNQCKLLELLNTFSLYTHFTNFRIHTIIIPHLGGTVSPFRSAHAA